MSKWSEIVLSKEAACTPEEKRKTDLAIVKDRKRSAAGRAAGSHSALIVPRKRGNSPRRTPWRERSEANCLTSGCKSRRRKSPCGAVVISGSPRGDPRAGSPDVKAPGGPVDFEPPRSGQHRGRATGRAVARANGLTAEMGPRTKLIHAEHRRCQEFLPSTRWPVPARKDGAVPVPDLPADVEGGNPGEPSSESSEGLVAGQDDPRMSKTVPITGRAGKWPGGDQTGG